MMHLSGHPFGRKLRGASLVGHLRSPRPWVPVGPDMQVSLGGARQQAGYPHRKSPRPDALRRALRPLCDAIFYSGDSIPYVMAPIGPTGLVSLTRTRADLYPRSPNRSGGVGWLPPHLSPQGASSWRFPADWRRFRCCACALMWRFLRPTWAGFVRRHRLPYLLLILTPSPGAPHRLNFPPIHTRPYVNPDYAVNRGFTERLVIRRDGAFQFENHRFASLAFATLLLTRGSRGRL